MAQLQERVERAELGLTAATESLEASEEALVKTTIERDELRDMNERSSAELRKTLEVWGVRMPGLRVSCHGYRTCKTTREQSWRRMCSHGTHSTVLLSHDRHMIHPHAELVLTTCTLPRRRVLGLRTDSECNWNRNWKCRKTSVKKKRCGYRCHSLLTCPFRWHPFLPKSIPSFLAEFPRL